MKKLKHLATIVSLYCLSTAAMAHPGHDHSAWHSSMIHGLVYGALALAAVTAVAWTLHKKSTTSVSHKNKK